MSRYEAMLSYAPLYYHSSNIFKAVLQAEGAELDTFRTDMTDMKSQLFIDSATWGLEFWEKEFGLPISNALSYEERRSRVKGKVRGIGKVGSGLIKAVSEAYSNGEVNVGLEDGIEVSFIGARGIPSAIGELEKQLEEVKPAHLPIEFIYRWLIWSEQDERNITWDELDALKLVWNEFETGGWLNA